MKEIFSAHGWRRLRGAWFLLAAAILTSAAFVAGTRWYLEKERGDTAGAQRRLQQASARVEAVRSERDTLERSAGVFRQLLERGMLQPERRLELVERVNELRARHQVMSLDYEISPQRALVLADGRAFPALDLFASRVKLRIRALHEGDALGFIEALAGSDQGMHPVERCQLRRLETASADALQPRVEAECTLEWITMREKRVA